MWIRLLNLAIGNHLSGIAYQTAIKYDETIKCKSVEQVFFTNEPQYFKRDKFRPLKVLYQIWTLKYKFLLNIRYPKCAEYKSRRNSTTTHKLHYNMSTNCTRIWVQTTLTIWVQTCHKSGQLSPWYPALTFHWRWWQPRHLIISYKFFLPFFVTNFL